MRTERFGEACRPDATPVRHRLVFGLRRPSCSGDAEVRTRGFTLVELLVALVLSGIVAAMAYRMFASDRKNYTRTRENVKLQAEAREAVRILEQEIRNMGLKVANNYSGRRVSTLTCPSGFAAPGTDSSSFHFADRTGWTNPGDEIVFLQYLPDETGTVSCIPTNFLALRYRLRTSDSTLVRSSASSVAGLATAPEVPFCKGVVAFQFQYGIQAPDSVLWGPTSTLASPSLTLSTAAGVTTTSGWTTTRGVLYTNASKPIVRGRKYRVEFLSTPNDSFIDSARGALRLTIGFLDGSTPRDTIPVFAGTTSGRRVEVDLVASTDIPAGRFAISAIMQTGVGGPQLRISDLRVIEKTLTEYEWIDSPTVAQKRRIRGVRLDLLARSNKETEGEVPGSFSSIGNLPTRAVSGVEAKRKYIVFQRIIPVVNNGI